MPVSVYYKCAVYLWSFGFSMDLLVLFRSLVEYNVTLISHQLWSSFVKPVVI